MSKIDSPDTLAALALVPEQLPAYVRGVTGLELRFANGFAVYFGGGTAVLVAAPTADDPDLGKYSGEEATTEPDPAVDEAIAEVSAWPGVRRISVLGTARPAVAPVDGKGYAEKRDSYLAVDLPCVGEGANFSGAPGQKLRNMLRRAERELKVGVEPWGPECRSLAKAYNASRPLEAGTRYIFEHLEAYVTNPEVNVFTARQRGTGTLHGLCVGDFTPFATAFYMFAFRKKDATPGAADLLLHALVLEAQRQGHERVNLGLAINGGIGFFKRKWGARPFMPLVECSWPLAAEKKGFFKKLLSCYD